MRIRGFLPKTILVVIAVISFTLAAQALTTEVDTTLGGSFTGTIGTAGEDFVQGVFAAAGGEEITLRVQAIGGSTLVPTVRLLDANGTPIAGGSSRRIRWMGVGNMTHVFTVPAAGLYRAEIGGSSGSGSFSAVLSGSPVVNNFLAVAGTVTDSATSDPIAGATVTVDAASYDTTDATGAFSGFLEPATYSFVFSASGYDTQMQDVTVSAGTPIGDLDVALVAMIVPTVEASVVSGDMIPDGTVLAKVAITMPAGTTINSITWTHNEGATPVITATDPENPMVMLAGLGDYKDELVHRLQEPAVTADELPPNVPLPPGEFPGGLQDRLQVVGINPFALEEAGLVELEVEVDTDIGVFTDHLEIHTEIPWNVAIGVRNVPINVPVLLQAKEHTSYDWTIAGAPAGSGAALSDAATRHPYFTPDMPGLYEFSLAEVPEGSDTLFVYAGTWRGIIVDQLDGRPVPDPSCLGCHDDDFAADKFTPWVQTGHAEIFTNNLNTSTHYGPNCFPCHTVGFGPDAENGSIDEADDYPDFIDAGLINVPGDNWTTMLEQFPDSAGLANIQCENCHGPQNSFGHAFGIEGSRTDISSDVCATCHGEPLRHARFQQWQLSGHANYELAIDEGDSGSCSRCHTGNGFLEWLPVLLDDDPDTDPLDDIFYCGDDDICVGGVNDGDACTDDDECPPEWTRDETHPQTCTTCHDPHAIGTTSGNDSNATVRISGDTPPLIAGFQVLDVGKGAICMTCHNSRRGVRNDSVWDALSTSEKARAPHGGAQTDVLVGENAYLVEVGDRGSHAFLEDTCVDCHMDSTPPPAVLSYNQGGTNHTFFAGRDICSDCHVATLDADAVQGGVHHLLDWVEELVEGGYFELIDDLTSGGKTVMLPGDCGSDDICDGGLNDGNACLDDDDCVSLISDAAVISEIQFGEYRGRQALTVTFSDTSVSGPHRIPDIDVLEAEMPTLELAAFADDALLKSGWNWALIHNDGSVGVHNPLYANKVLVAARNALVELMGGTSLSPREPSQGRPGTDGTQKPFGTVRALRR